MSSSGTPHSTPANSSGACVIVAPTSKPPFERPPMARRSRVVQPFAISHSAAAMKSSKTRCFASFVPASCQASPYSPPPRRLGMARRPPSSSHTRLGTEKLGVIEMPKPP
jgi:hypothetical protein